jgi:hypothetical protein
MQVVVSERLVKRQALHIPIMMDERNRVSSQLELLAFDPDSTFSRRPQSRSFLNQQLSKLFNQDLRIPVLGHGCRDEIRRHGNASFEYVGRLRGDCVGCPVVVRLEST